MCKHCARVPNPADRPVVHLFAALAARRLSEAVATETYTADEVTLEVACGPYRVTLLGREEGT
jgi:hypothetical protein